MKKRSIAAAAVLSAVAATNLTPAFATPAAVSDVKVAWADAAHSAVKITWTSPLADTVVLTGGGLGTRTLGSTAAGAPDELTVPVAKLGATYDPAASSQIVVTDSAGAKGTSVKFDQYVPRGVPSSVTFGAGNAVQGTTKIAQHADTTPGDPLDVSVPLSYTPRLKTGCKDTLFATSTSPSFKLPAPGAPSSLWIDTANEWGVPEWDGTYGYGITTTALKTSAPTTSPYGQVFTISGYVLQNQQYYTPWNNDCGIEQVESISGTVIVQARKDSASAWGVVGSTKADALGGFSYKVTNPGTRQYRVVVPNYAGTNRLDYGLVGGVRTVAATTRVMSAKFLSTSVVYGKPATAYLAVLPGGSQRALLQAKSTSGVGSGVTYKTLTGGKGYATFTWRRRGLTAFRWYSPATKTSSGLSVGAVFTGPFYLTVR